MAKRSRRRNPSSARPRRLSSSQLSPPSTRHSPRRPSPTQATVSNALPRQRDPSIRPATPLFQQCARGHSTSGTTSALKPAIHNNPFVANRCRALRGQMAHLKHKIEDLSAVIDELQPEHSAMDWASSAGTVIYVPVRVNKENEAPRAAPAHPEVQRPEGSTFPDASPSFRETDNAFGLGRTVNRPLYSEGPVELSLPHTFQLGSRTWRPTSGADAATQPGPSREPVGQGSTSLFPSPASFGNLGAQQAPSMDLSIGEAMRPQHTDTGPHAKQVSPRRHAYVEDDRLEESGRSVS